MTAIRRTTARLAKQDKLEEGLLRTEDGSYVPISRYGKNIEDFWERFATMSEQRKLKEGLIKIERTGDYLAIDTLGEIENGDCFVATTVYGSRDAPQVNTLRDFRDDVLMQSIIGRVMVNFYYSGAGKKTANFIEEHLPSTIPVIRRGLDFLVERYSTKKK